MIDISNITLNHIKNAKEIVTVMISGEKYRNMEYRKILCLHENKFPLWEKVLTSA